jgi:hyperosmotically inducible protein
MKNRMAYLLPATLLLGIVIAEGTTACSKFKDTIGIGEPPKATASATLAEITDDEITVKLKDAMLRNENLKDIDIYVATTKGTVTLSGWVNTRSQLDQTLKLAEGVEGVRNVRNNLMSKR